MTIHLGKGTMTVKSVDGFEYQYEVSNCQFEPECTADRSFVVDESTHFKYAHLTAGIDVAADRLSIAVFDGRMRIVDMQKELFREFVIKPFIDDFKIQMATPPKNKPYYRQFEKRGKW